MSNDFQFRKLSQVRSFRGTFRGKIIKPVDDDDNLKKLEDFEKDDIVWVLKASDFRDFLLTVDRVRNVDIKELNRIDHELDSMDSRESMVIQLEKAVKLLNDISEIKEEKIKLREFLFSLFFVFLGFRFFGFFLGFLGFGVYLSLFSCFYPCFFS